MRVYPQDQNTGGFFVSVIQKVAEMPHGKPPAAAEGETEGKRKSNGDDEDDDDMQIVVDPQLKFLVKELVGKEMRGDTPADGAAAAGEGEEGEAAQDSSSSTRRSRGGKKWGKEEPFLPLTGVMLSEWQAAKYARSCIHHFRRVSCVVCSPRDGGTGSTTVCRTSSQSRS